MTNDKFDELIKKQIQREKSLKQVREDYMDEMKAFPKKQITVKLFPNTHKALKIIATAKETTLETIATSILEDKIEGLDIVEYVKVSFEKGNDGFDFHCLSVYYVFLEFTEMCSFFDVHLLLGMRWLRFGRMAQRHNAQHFIT